MLVLCTTVNTKTSKCFTTDYCVRNHTLDSLCYCELWLCLHKSLILNFFHVTNNTRDIVPDKRAEIRTMAMGLGKKVSAWLYSFEVIFPFVWIGVCSIIGLMPIYTVFVFLTLPIALGCSRTMVKAVNSGSDIISDLDVRTANLQLLFSVILSITFIVSKFIA